MIESRRHHYFDGSEEHIGAVAHDAQISGARPGVIVVHAFGGLGDFEIEQTKMLARLGYVGFAIDLYGNGQRASSREEAFELMNALNSDRGELRRRLLRAQQLRS